MKKIIFSLFLITSSAFARPEIISQLPGAPQKSWTFSDYVYSVSLGVPAAALGYYLGSFWLSGSEYKRLIPGITAAIGALSGAGYLYFRSIASYIDPILHPIGDSLWNSEPSSTNYNQAQQVNRIGRRITKAAEELYGIKLDWKIKLSPSREVNAFCAPGGKIVIHEGILPIAKSEAGLAAIMGHEVGHALACHSSCRLLLQLTTTAISFTIKEAIISYNNITKKDFKKSMDYVSDIAASLAVQLPYSRSNELEADIIGLFLMAKAGYDPREAKEVWLRMNKNNLFQVPEFLSTHPHNLNRVEEIDAHLDDALEIYDNLPNNQKIGLGNLF